MNIEDTLAPNSDQLDAIELLGQPRTFTITDVTRGDVEQPVQIHLADFPRPWRPGKSMRRVLAACWGTETSVYVGRRVTLYCDEKVRFGSEVVGGTRIAALSHIDKPRSVPLLVSRGKSAIFTVKPLTEPAPASIDKKTADAIAHYQSTYGVTVAQLEAYVASPSSDWTAADLATLRALADELKAGGKRVADEFPPAEARTDQRQG